MATWYGGTDAVRDNGFGVSRGGKRIEGAVFHHGAGLDVLDYVANWNSRDSHSTYHAATNGNITGIVHPDRRPSSTSHSVDSVAITFEIDNSAMGGNWPVSDAALSEAINVCVHHAKEQGLKKFALNTPGRDQPGVFFIAWHSQYVSTACPGPHITSLLNYIVAECQRRLDNGAAPAPRPPAPPADNTTYERAWGGESGAPLWPRGTLMKRIQAGLKARGRYDGPVDGVGGQATAKGIQLTIQIGGGYAGPIDGKLGLNSAKGVQRYAQRWGGYVGAIDGDPQKFSWTGFAIGLETD